MNYRTDKKVKQLSELDMPTKCLLLITMLSEITLAIMAVCDTTTAVCTMFGIYGVFMLIITYVFFEKIANRDTGDTQPPSSAQLAV